MRVLLKLEAMPASTFHLAIGMLQDRVCLCQHPIVMSRTECEYHRHGKAAFYAVLEPGS
jgi:hypothetical protein